MSDEKDIMYDLLKEVRDDVKEHREDTLEHQHQTNGRLDIYNEQLKVHIDGVQTLKQLHLDNVDRIRENEDRMNKIEEPSKLRKLLGNKIIKVLGTITLVCGTIMAIAKVITLL
jgi:hypothetical protein